MREKPERNKEGLNHRWTRMDTDFSGAKGTRLARGYNTMYAEAVQSKFSHARIDRRNAAHDRQIAAKLRGSDLLLRLARKNLKRWMARDGQRVRAVFREWH